MTQGSRGSPKIINKFLQDTEVYEHEDVTLQCRAVGDVIISVAWMHKGRVLQNRTTNTDLNIGRVGRTDSGDYRCEVTNSDGSDVDRMHLEVKGNICILLPPPREYSL